MPRLMNCKKNMYLKHIRSCISVLTYRALLYRVAQVIWHVHVQQHKGRVKWFPGTLYTPSRTLCLWFRRQWVTKLLSSEMWRRAVYNPRTESRGATQNLNLYMHHFIPCGRRGEGSGTEDEKYYLLQHLYEKTWITLHKKKISALHWNNRTTHINALGAQNYFLKVKTYWYIQ